MSGKEVDELYEQYDSLVKYLLKKDEPSFVFYIENTFRKVILIASASFFEEEIKRLIIEFSEKHTNNRIELVELVKNKVILRQYHTFFEWNGKNANKFFALFGNDFKKACVKDVNANAKLDDAIASFIEIGRNRNILLHQNFAAVSTQKTAEEGHESQPDNLDRVPISDKTAEEWYESHKRSIKFVDYLKKKLLENLH